MNPWQILGPAAIALVLTIGGFGAGWTVNGWRLGKDAQAERAERAEGSLAATGEVLDRAAALTEMLVTYARGGVAREQAIMNAAKDGQNVVKAYVAAHDGCRVTDDDVELLLRNEAARHAAASSAASD